MATAQQLKALLQSYSEADGEMFVSVALQIAAHEARTGKGKFASEIKRLVDEIKGKQRESKVGGSVPISRPTGELATLLSATYPRTRFSEMVLARTAMRLDDSESKRFLRALPSMYQLLPNDLLNQQTLPVWGDAEAGPWLRFDASQTGYPHRLDDPDDPSSQVPLDDCSTAFPAVYEDIYTGFAEQIAGRNVYMNHVEAARVFDQRLLAKGKIYLHPRTYCIAAMGVETPAQIEVPVYGTVELVGTDYVYTVKSGFFGSENEAPLKIVGGPGDGFVPLLSANPPAEMMTHPFAAFGVPYPPIVNVEHADLPNERDVIRMLVDEIVRVVTLKEADKDKEAPDDSPIRLEYRSMYTAQTPPGDRNYCYTMSEWVPNQELPFLVGQGREISVRVAGGAIASWEVKPIGKHSGTVTLDGSNSDKITFVPEVTLEQRPIGKPTQKNAPNLAVTYEITANVEIGAVVHQKVERITQDERDIIRQEYVDEQTWRKGWLQVYYKTVNKEKVRVERVSKAFTLPVPYREFFEESPARRDGLKGNYDLILNSALLDIYYAVQAKVEAFRIYVSSGWRNPRRNIEADSTAEDSNHQHGGALDMQPTREDGLYWPSGERGTAEWRRGLLTIYNAACEAIAEGAGGGAKSWVMLENMSAPLYEDKKAFPVPNGDDADDDGLPDDAEHNNKLLSAIFNSATHVHADRYPVGGGDDDVGKK